MAKFSIDYSQRLPSGQSAARPITGDTAAPYRALAQLGQSITGITEDIQAQKDALDYSEGQRQVDERINAAYESLTGDEESDAKIWDTVQKDVDGIQYKSKAVNNKLTMYVNRIAPGVQKSLMDRHQGIVQQNAIDGMKAEGQTRLAKGDLDGYQDILDEQFKTKAITKTEYEAKTKSALPDSLLQQARDLMASDSAADNHRAVGILSNITKLEGVELSTEQTEYRNRMLKLATKTTTEKSDAAITDVVIQMDNLKGKSALEKEAAAAEMKQSLVNGGVSDDKLNQYFGILNEWSGGDKDPTEEYDPQMYAALSAQVDLDPSKISDAQIYSLVGKGKDGGITSQQASSFVDARKRNIDDVGSVQNEVHRRYQDILKAQFNNEEIGSAYDYAELANKLTVYANTNKDATPEQFEKFFVALTAPTQKKSWLKMAFTPPIRSIYGIFDAGRKIRNLNKLKEQAKGEPISATVGDVITAKGQKWRLVSKGETPDKDVYERAE